MNEMHAILANELKPILDKVFKANKSQLLLKPNISKLANDMATLMFCIQDDADIQDIWLNCFVGADSRPSEITMQLVLNISPNWKTWRAKNYIDLVKNAINNAPADSSISLLNIDGVNMSVSVNNTVFKIQTIIYFFANEQVAYPRPAGLGYVCCNYDTNDYDPFYPFNR